MIFQSDICEIYQVFKILSTKLKKMHVCIFTLTVSSGHHCNNIKLAVRPTNFLYIHINICRNLINFFSSIYTNLK